MTSELIPELGQQIELDDYLFTIEEVDETKIEIVRLKILPKDREEASENVF